MILIFLGQIRSKIGFKLIKTSFGARRSGFMPSEVILLFKEVIFLELMTQNLVHLYLTDREL